MRLVHWSIRGCQFDIQLKGVQVSSATTAHVDAAIATPSVLLRDLCAAREPRMTCILGTWIIAARCHLTVQMIADQSGVPTRTRSEECRTLGLPAPKQLSDWLCVLYI